MKVTADNFSDAIMQAINDYAESVENEMKKEVETTARTIRNMLLVHPRVPVRTGEYKRGFRIKKRAEGPGYLRMKVYNTKYQITHLLEKGHDIKRNGKVIGHAPEYPHWKDAQDIADKMSVRMKERLDKLK